MMFHGFFIWQDDIQSNNYFEKDMVYRINLPFLELNVLNCFSPEFGKTIHQV